MVSDDGDHSTRSEERNLWSIWHKSLRFSGVSWSWIPFWKKSQYCPSTFAYWFHYKENQIFLKVCLESSFFNSIHLASSPPPSLEYLTFSVLSKAADLDLEATSTQPRLIRARRAEGKQPPKQNIFLCRIARSIWKMIFLTSSKMVLALAEKLKRIQKVIFKKIFEGFSSVTYWFKCLGLS